MLSPDRIPDLASLAHAADDYDVVRQAIAYHLRALARPAGGRSHRACRRRDARRVAPSVPPLGRADAEGIPAGADHRPCARAAARFRERARRRLRGRPVRPRPAARSVRRARGDVARRMEDRRRRPDHALRLSPLAVRHRAGDRDRARPCRSCFRRSGRANSAALADMQRRWPRATYVEDTARTAPLARRIFDPSTVARRTSRCASS